MIMSKPASPIPAWFVPRILPYGTTPEHIKEQWIDVPLPVRDLGGVESPELTIGHDFGNMLSIIVREGIGVNAGDAMKSLRIFGRGKAADFWSQYLSDKDEMNFGIDEGRIYPTAAIQRILPGIEFFDSID